MPLLEITTRDIGERTGLDRRAITRPFGGEIEPFIALLQAVSLAGDVFGPSSPRSAPENRLRIFLLLRRLASLGPELTRIVGLDDSGADGSH